MILIFSREGDASTGYVAEWLHFFNKCFLIVCTDNERTKFISYSNDEVLIEQNGQMFNLLNTSSVWNRRNGFSKNTLSIDESNTSRVFCDREDFFYQHHRKEETNCLFSFLHAIFAFRNIKELGCYSNNDVNKMEVLMLAQKVGLQIPESFIFVQKADLIRLISQNKDRLIITKPLSQGVYRVERHINYYNYVERITEKFVKSLPETFFPSLFQIEIKKQYELRIFYLKGQCYSMAIFAQTNKSTETDFRKPNFSKRANRYVPYQLPYEVHDKIKKVMDALSLNTGSIDMLIDQNENYIFLEVNPVGQFSMTSHPCNYYLEKKIAETL